MCRKTEELPGDEGSPAHRLREQHEDGALLHLLMDEPGGNEDGHDKPEPRHRDQAKVLHHATLFPQADRAQPQTAGDHHQGEHDDDR